MIYYLGVGFFLIFYFIILSSFALEASCESLTFVSAWLLFWRFYLRVACAFVEMSPALSDSSCLACALLLHRLPLFDFVGVDGLGFRVTSRWCCLICMVRLLCMFFFVMVLALSVLNVGLFMLRCAAGVSSC